MIFTSNHLLIPCEGIGTIITRLPSSPQPIAITPIYYCPTITVSILFTSALIQRNPHFDITLHPHTSLTLRELHSTTATSLLPTILHDDMDYISIPIYFLCTKDDVTGRNVPLPLLILMTTKKHLYLQLSPQRNNQKIHFYIQSLTSKDKQGQVNKNNFQALQHTLLDSYIHYHSSALIAKQSSISTVVQMYMQPTIDQILLYFII